MPNNSYADLVHEADSLTTSVQENISKLEGVDPLLAQHTTAVDELKQTKALQQQMEGARQEATQLLKQAAENVRETIRRLRSFVKSKLGTKNERLNQYGAAPIRSRSNRGVAPNPPEVPPTPPVE